MTGIKRIYYYCSVEYARDSIRIWVDDMEGEGSNNVTASEVTRTDTHVLYVVSPIVMFNSQCSIIIYVYFDDNYHMYPSCEANNESRCSELFPDDAIEHPLSHIYSSGGPNRGIEVHYNILEEV